MIRSECDPEIQQEAKFLLKNFLVVEKEAEEIQIKHGTKKERFISKPNYKTRDKIISKAKRSTNFEDKNYPPDLEEIEEDYKIAYDCLNKYKKNPNAINEEIKKYSKVTNPEIIKKVSKPPIDPLITMEIRHAKVNKQREQRLLFK